MKRPNKDTGVRGKVNKTASPIPEFYDDPKNIEMCFNHFHEMAVVIAAKYDMGGVDVLEFIGAMLVAAARASRDDADVVETYRSIIPSSEAV